MIGINKIDEFLNKTTMYRLLVIFLLSLSGIAIIFSFFGILQYNPLYIITELVFLVAACHLVNQLFAKVFSVPDNYESATITALILSLIITPGAPADYFWFYTWAAILAMASKYILTINKKHIFNPVAISVVLTSFVLGFSADWWIAGNLFILPFILIFGLLIVRKTRRLDMMLGFFVTYFIVTSFIAFINNVSIFQNLLLIITHTSIFFFAFFMLTEPLTTPPSRWLQVLYGVSVALLFDNSIHLFSVYSTPELALVVGNIFSFIISPKVKSILTIVDIKNIAKDTYEFIFMPDRKINFKPGQYCEWTLPLEENDNRGNRRYFTIASSPTEDYIKLGVKFYNPPSNFKKELLNMNKGDTLSISSLSGDFILPKDRNKKLVFIAGGIGITPFKSMIQYLLDKKEKRDIVIFYSNKSFEEIAYFDLLKRANQELNIRLVYAITAPIMDQEIDNWWAGERRSIDTNMIRFHAPDYLDRVFYISGPHGMVSGFEGILGDMGVKNSDIKSDFFPGFV